MQSLANLPLLVFLALFGSGVALAGVRAIGVHDAVVQIQHEQSEAAEALYGAFHRP